MTRVGPLLALGLVTTASALGLACATFLGADPPIEVTDAGDAAVEETPDHTTPAPGVPWSCDAGGSPAQIVAAPALELLPSPSSALTTEDGYVAYTDGHSVRIVRLTRGAIPAAVIPLPDSGLVAEYQGGTILLTLFTFALETTVGKLYAFSAGTGVHLLSSVAGWGTLSADGSRVTVAELGTSGLWSLRVTTVVGTPSVPLASSVPYANISCLPQPVFAGVRDDRVVVAECDASGVASLHEYVIDGGSAVDRLLSSELPNAVWTTDHAGDFAAAVEASPDGGSAGRLVVYDLGAGTSTVIDDDVPFTGVFVGTGSTESILYATTTALKRSTLVTPSPVVLDTLLPSESLASISPDSIHAVLWPSGLVGPEEEARLVSTTAADRVVATVTGSSIADTWTTDGRKVLWTLGALDGGSSLEEVDVGDGGGTTVDTAVGSVTALTGERVAAVAAIPAGQAPGDLVVYDLGAAPPLRRVVASGVSLFAPTPDGCQLVYTLQGDGGDASSQRDGLWMVPAR